MSRGGLYRGDRASKRNVNKEWICPMGSRDDGRLQERHEAGKEEVFFVTNCVDDVPWIQGFLRAVQAVGSLRPIFYSQAGRWVLPGGGHTNTVDDQIRDDFFPAGTKVLYFGETRTNSDFEDHWVLPNFRAVLSQSNLLVYISKNYPPEILHRFGFGREPEVVSTVEEFEASLTEHLRSLHERK